jgi:PKD repeat protein
VIATPGTPTPTPTLPLSFLNVSGSATVGALVTFGVSSSVAGATWIWSFGDGATEQGTAFSTTHTYSVAGTYTASVSSASTQASSATIVVTAATAVPPPTTSAGFVATIACPKTTTQTQACNVTTSLNGVAQQSSTITRVDWDWGDGQTTQTNGSFAPVSSHLYTNPGTYTVFATVTGAPPLGVSQSTTTSITVTVPTP